VGLLTWQLSGQRPAAATGRTEIYGDSYGGPVIDQWRQTLTEVPAAATATRRVQRLLNTSSPLWHAIATTQGPLRLPWPTVVNWAKADADRAGYV
jgi:hypothetical protein